MNTDLGNHRYCKDNLDLGTEPVPVETCVSPEFFEREREKIFRRLWLNVGRDEDLPRKGDYIVKDLAVGNASVLVVRGQDGKVRAFHNVCMHRGNRLAWEDKGHCNGMFVCRFHAWAFDQQGNLKHVSDEANFHDLDKATLGLKPLAADVWQGFIFVNLDLSPSETLLEYLGGLAEHLNGYPFENQPRAFKFGVDEQTNWKVLIDAQNEIYHLPYLHKRSFPVFGPRNDHHATRTLAFRRFGRHGVYSVEQEKVERPTALEKVVDILAPTTGKADQMIGWFDFYTVFPNFVIMFLGKSSYLTYNVWPLAVDRSRWEISLYGPAPKNPAERIAMEYRVTRLRDLMQEDGGNHEAIQASLSTGAITHFQFQDEEIQLRHFHKVVREEVLGPNSL
jgi:phenylpropionate dioxygenase-like ring-hydroxylating dioxygenase large terminal subunit